MQNVSYSIVLLTNIYIIIYTGNSQMLSCWDEKCYIIPSEVSP